MAGYAQQKAKLEEAGVNVFAASSDSAGKAREVAQEVGFPIAYGVTQEQADAIGAWWEDKRGFIQPAEFVLDREGNVLSATYSTGPVGRLPAEDALALVKILSSRRQGNG